MSVELAWAAGFLDGEATFYRSFGSPSQGSPKGGGQYRRVEVSARNVDPRPIERLHALFGGRVYPYAAARPNWNDQVGWVVTGDQAVACSRALLPFLVVKAEAAVLLIEWWVLRPYAHRPRAARVRGDAYL